MAKIKMKPIRIFAPITRIDEEKREVEGYAFVNEVVPGEGGVRLRRDSMETATPDYLLNGTVRAMHQPIAAGKPLEVEWDEKGAYLRAKIVDDQEWEKVKEGVYKGFSIGVNATAMRGKDVTACEWWDSSLVDRGKDRDALFTVWRGEGEEEREVEILDEESDLTTTTPRHEENIRRDFNDGLDDLAAMDMREDLSDAFYMLLWVLADDCETAQECNESIDQFAVYAKGCCADSMAGGEEQNRAYFGGLISRAGKRPAKKESGHDSAPEGYPSKRSQYADPQNYKYPIDTAEHVRAAWSYIHKATNRAEYSAEELAYVEGRIRMAAKKMDVTLSEERVSEEATLQRLAAMETSHTEMTERVMTAETELARVQAALSDKETALAAAEEQVRTLERSPAPVTAPVRYPTALDRTFAANEAADADVTQTEALKTEYHRLNDELPNEPVENKRQAGVERMLLIRRELAARGIAL